MTREEAKQQLLSMVKMENLSVKQGGFQFNGPSHSKYSFTLNGKILDIDIDLKLEVKISHKHHVNFETGRALLDLAIDEFLDHNFKFDGM